MSHATQYGSATADVDCAYGEERITFAPGEITKTVTVPFIDDTDPEPDESFFVQLYDPASGVVGDR